jgi:hypothetical protein
MNKQFGRLLLAGVCVWIVAPAATGQDSPPPSHRLFEPDFSNLSQAESLLARRLRHQEDVQRLQELVKGLSKATPQERQEFQDIIKNHPEIADDPELFGLLNKAKEFKENGFLSPKMREELGRQAKDFLTKLKEKDSASPNSPNEGPPDLTHPPTNELIHTPDIPPPPIVPKPEGMGNEIKQGLTDLIKKVETSSEGEALRKAALKDLAENDRGPSSTADLSDFLHHVITPSQANWLSRNLTLPALPNFDGWSSNPSLAGGSSVGGSSSGGVDAMVWVVALALFGVAAVLALRAAKGQAGGDAKTWSAGPWPVHPSRVSTREDLIRAFEHLAFLRLGLRARPLNHIDLAGRLGDTGDRAEPAARLTHLYEQARYAPPDELLPADELAAARGDLSTLAGAAA